ncbi:cell cycle checkpoint protein RAD17 [Ophiocordyceps sinensis CO18]|uniref:Cell cycle checkpoint protein RAD17 n=1 Tax=Ophiocordyceps sinensis (strain Co18 / CGMCC 3.14243) TaxID=911162 RepID=T5APV3_OPHSC|nr:cell cycle checkpoint protein RAD17 [Ophiocordyceps sinensis CO18]
MASILSYVPVTGRRVRSSQAKLGSVNLAPVQVHQIETNPDRRARCLKHLLKANHVNYSIAYSDNLISGNCSPHLLSTAYLLGASEVKLHALYEEGIKSLEPWTPSPAEIVDLDWTDFLGDKRYQRAYVDFFEDKLAMTFAYDWKQEAEHFLFSGERPLVHVLIGGRTVPRVLEQAQNANPHLVGRSLIHLAYAYEMDCKEVGMEALGLACVEYDFLHKYTDDASYTKPSPLASGSPLDLLTKISEDERFNSLPKNIDVGQLEALFEEHEDLIMEYWNAWELDDLSEQFQQSQETAVSLAVALVGPDIHTYDFLLVHLLTISHAARILLPFFPPQYQNTIVRQWWLIAIIVFIIKGRPRPNSDNVQKEIGDKDWKYVESQALTSRWSKDAHYIKGERAACHARHDWMLTDTAIRAMREASKTWGDAQRECIRAAVTFVDNFERWNV